MSIEMVYGNILDTNLDVILQQANTRGVMGSGLAKQIRSSYPEVFTNYYERCRDASFDPEELMGKVSTTRVWNKKKEKYQWIASIFGQSNFGSDGKQYTDYDALRNGLLNVKWWNQMQKRSIAIPYQIGCGLGGGKWEIVYKMIDEVFQSFPYKVEIWNIEDEPRIDSENRTGIN